MAAFLACRRPRPLLLLVVTATVLSYANNQSVGVAIPVFLIRDLEGIPSDVGVVGAFATGGAIAGRLIAGLLVARFSSGKVLVSASVAMLMLSALYPAVNSLPGVAAVRVLHLAAFAVVTSTAVVTAAELVSAQRREAALAAIGMAMPISAMVFPAIAAVVLDARLGAVALLATALSLLAALLFSAVRNVDEGHAHGPGAVAAPDVAIPLRSPAFLVVAAATAIGAADAVAVDFLPVVSLARGISGYGWFYTAFAAAMVAALVQLRRVSWQARADVVAEVGLVATGVALVLLAVASDLATLLLAGVAFGLGFAAAQTGLTVWLATNTRRPQRGRRIAALYVSFDVGRGVGVYSVGWVATSLGFPIALTLVACYCGLHALALRGPRWGSR